MDPLVDFSYLGMPQAEQGGQMEAEEEWGELDENEEDLDWVATAKLQSSCFRLSFHCELISISCE